MTVLIQFCEMRDTSYFVHTQDLPEKILQDWVPPDRRFFIVHDLIGTATSKARSTPGDTRHSPDLSVQTNYEDNETETSEPLCTPIKYRASGAETSEPLSTTITYSASGGSELQSLYYCGMCIHFYLYIYSFCIYSRSAESCTGPI